MKQNNIYPRLDPEWITLNAVRDLIKLATQADHSKSTYNNALELGAAICPEILGSDVSIIKQNRERDLTKEYRQRATYTSIKENMEVTPLSLIQQDITEYESLLEISKSAKDKTETDKLQKRLNQLYLSEEELNPEKSSENQLIFRDAYKVDRNYPVLTESKNSRTFELLDNNYLTIRVLHPEIPEHITGADLVYERHDKNTNKIIIAFVQYKIWENKVMYLSDARLNKQIDKMKNFLCENKICHSDQENKEYRFPYCAAFLRPTDKLQSPNQALVSTGEHLPICYLNKWKTTTGRNAEVLEYKHLSKLSLSHDIFGELFNKGKIGSKPLSLEELIELYKNTEILSSKDRLLLYAQDYPI